jgi:hypothetical protein
MTADLVITVATYTALAFNLAVAVWSWRRVRVWQRLERAQMQAWADREQEQYARWQEASRTLQTQWEEAVRTLMAPRQPWEYDA